MHTIAGAILVLAGAVLISSGVVGECLATRGSSYEPGYILGAAIGIIGVVMMCSRWIKKKWDDIGKHKSDDA